MDENKLLELELADAIIEKPQWFSVGRRHFYLYPVTLGKMYLLQRLTSLLELKEENIKINPYLEVLRVIGEHRMSCCRLLAYHTFSSKKDFFSKKKMDDRTNFFHKELSDEDLGSLLVLILTRSDFTVQFIRFLKIDKEQERMDEVSRVKDNKNTFSFGGKSVYGMLIDGACERYGWTMEYVLWGISYTNLQLLLKDSVKTVYLTDEEAKRVHINNENNIIDGNDESVIDYIRNTSWN